MRMVTINMSTVKKVTLWKQLAPETLGLSLWQPSQSPTVCLKARGVLTAKLEGGPTKPGCAGGRAQGPLPLPPHPTSTLAQPRARRQRSTCHVSKYLVINQAYRLLNMF